jgi:hypothetical protein
MNDVSLVKKVSELSITGIFKNISSSKKKYSMSFPLLLGGRRDNILDDGDSKR